MDESSARFGTEQRGQRHAVHVAARRARRRVHVAVRVDPQQPERLARVARVRGRCRHRSSAQAVVAAQHQRKRAFFDRRARGLIQAVADLGDLLDELLSGIAVLSRFRDGRRQVAAIDDEAAQFRDPFTAARRCGTRTAPCRRRGGCRPCRAARRSNELAGARPYNTSKNRRSGDQEECSLIS